MEEHDSGFGTIRFIIIDGFKQERQRGSQTRPKLEDFDRGVVSAVDLASSSSHGGSIVAGTSGGEEAALDLESKKIVKRKQKKTKIEKDLQDKVKGAGIGAPMLFPTVKSISDRW
ncbi:hypothetical protein F383_20267 [Gossypium arboreum]|uniref:Uncharacterized protein n=1 Tax=Gossypium arboreum TaxID=29729 RepID=A0A0B0NS57_GOSAR|nr:hypothetical protein F383_20267 [Gossypium arboreum]